MTGRWAADGLFLVWSLAALGCGSSKHSSDGDGNRHPAAGMGAGGDAGSGATGGGGKGGAGSSGKGGSNTAGGTGGGTTGGAGGSAAGGTGGDMPGGGGATSGTGGATSGAGGSGTSTGQTGTLPAEPPDFIPVRQASTVDKLDLLLMIDNSISMAEKEALLAQSVPRLVRRLTQPDCVDENGEPTGSIADANGLCSDGVPEITASDVHIGIITSSLGDHGSGDDGVCSAKRAAESGANYNDLAALLPSVRTGLTSWDDSGFLAWNPKTPMIQGSMEQDRGALNQAFLDQLDAVGENGCGYESSLEAWFRFLVDPDPIQGMNGDPASAKALRGEKNSLVLTQRQQFLRTDSAVAIVMMTDENDCSIIDENDAQGWLVGYLGDPMSGMLWHMPRGTSACDSDPNDPCCYPCSAAAVAGCPSSDAACTNGAATTIDTAHDSMNMRCFDQKRRFGIDLLYPVSRYVEALTSPTIHARNRVYTTANPLFDQAMGTWRTPGSVILMGIVGVPWQDLATEESWGSPRELTYLTASELVAQDRWKVILGDPSTNGVPTDTLMVESIDPRLAPLPQAHPLIPGFMIGAPNAMSNTNPINGHEQAPLQVRDELQLACIFPLLAPVTCTQDNADSCECNADEYDKNSPLCTGVTPTTDGVQAFAKAYPGRRELDVLRGIGDQAVVTSICPKAITPPSGLPIESDGSYGYNPAVDALVRRLRPVFAPSCLTAPLIVSDTSPGGTACHLLELEKGQNCECDLLAREDPSEEDLAKARQHLMARGLCADDASCAADFCVCQIPGLTGEDLAACKADVVTDGPTSGFCYLSGDSSPGNPYLLDCPVGLKATFQFTGINGAPRDGTEVFASCNR
ncbi:MAG TPA: hypothetical protein VNN72_16995 [Polyangiaceae bacterium]|nr:hypothetical protein [Polyangiaceae bacterium]